MWYQSLYFYQLCLPSAGGVCFDNIQNYTIMYLVLYCLTLCLPNTPRPPQLGRKQDLKVEQKHYKASVCVVGMIVYMIIHLTNIIMISESPFRLRHVP